MSMHRYLHQQGGLTLFGHELRNHTKIFLSETLDHWNILEHKDQDEHCIRVEFFLQCMEMNLLREQNKPLVWETEKIYNSETEFKES